MFLRSAEMLFVFSIKLLMGCWQDWVTLALVKRVRLVTVEQLAKATRELVAGAMQPVAPRPVEENRPAQAKLERLLGSPAPV